MRMSKTKIAMRAQRKSNSELLETILEAKKLKGWEKIAKILSGATKRQASVNLSQIDKETKVGDTVVIPGKVLSLGELTKKVRIVALSFSASALEKIKEAKGEAVTILEEIKKNSKGEGIKLIR
tara:strand:- start:141 stop:512 length:372 start_codon:yes stop_codon:yes gene_type:complete